MKFDGVVFFIVFELDSANSCRSSMAFNFFSQSVVFSWSSKVLKVSYVFLSRGLLTDVVRFLNAPWVFVNPVELFWLVLLLTLLPGGWRDKITLSCC